MVILNFYELYCQADSTLQSVLKIYSSFLSKVCTTPHARLNIFNCGIIGYYVTSGRRIENYGRRSAKDVFSDDSHGKELQNPAR